MKYCPHCGTELTEQTAFCSECGKRINSAEHSNLPETAEAVKVTAQKNSKTKALGIIIALGVVIAALAVVVFLSTTGMFSEKTDAFSDDPAAISAASQSVVMLNCYDKTGEVFATGSGFAFFEDGVIVTNYHVIDEDVYSIEAFTEAGDSFVLKWILACDKEKDIAILGTDETTKLALLPQGDSQALQKGEKVVAIGSPLGLINSVSSGVFSAYVQEAEMDVLQFTASISSGSSGGALFNDNGEVLGITYASYEAGQNLNLAVPIEEVTALWTARSDTDKQTVADFYESQVHIYTVDYVIKNYEKLLGRTFYVEGWVYSHRVQQYNEKATFGYCTLYSSVDDFPTGEVSEHLLYENTHSDIYKNICVLIVDTAYNKPLKEYEEMSAGDYRCVEVSIVQDTSYGLIYLDDRGALVAD